MLMYKIKNNSVQFFGLESGARGILSPLSMVTPLVLFNFKYIFITRSNAIVVLL